MSDEVVHHRFGPSLRQHLIVGRTALVVAMCTQLDGHIGVFVEQFHQIIKSLHRFVTQGIFVEIVKDVVYQHRHTD